MEIAVHFFKNLIATGGQQWFNLLFRARMLAFWSRQTLSILLVMVSLLTSAATGSPKEGTGVTTDADLSLTVDAPSELTSAAASLSNSLSSSSPWNRSWTELNRGGPRLETDCFWGGVEYLLWNSPERELPPLVTTSLVGTDQSAAGVLEQPGTIILLGGEAIQAGRHPGGRITLGKWLNPCHTWGIGVRFFELAGTSFGFAATDDEFPILARPFLNASTGQQDALVMAFPGVLTGAVQVQGETDFWGGDIFLKRRGAVHPCGHFDFIVGFQHGRIDDHLMISSHSTAVSENGSIPQGTQLTIRDAIRTRNDFNGASLGVIANWARRGCRVELLAKIGLGTMSQQAAIQGTTTMALPNLPPTTSSQGLLAQPSNAGVFQSNRFLACPEWGVNFLWRLSPRVSIKAGYSCIYWSHLLQAGNQIDFQVNPTQVPGPTVGEVRPLFSLQQTAYLVHGLTFGMTCRF